jgi:hypothetical protein
MSNFNNINTNIDDYTTEELFQILNLDEDSSIYMINKTVNEKIEQFKYKGEDNTIIDFLKKTRDRLINELQSEYTDENDETIEENENKEITKAEEWYKNQYLPPSNRLQSIKITDRVQQVETFNENAHFPMKPNMLGVNNAYQLPVAQDSLNPTLRNINSTIINLDSQFRNIISPYVPNDPNAPSSSTNYTIDLTEPLTNVLSIRVYSIQIPNTWYRFSEDQGNTCFCIDFSGNEYKFVLPSGNYTSSEIVDELNDLNNWDPSFNPLGNLEWSYNQNTAKFEFYVNGSVQFFLYDADGKYVCNPACINVTQLNQNLGWLLGFRVTNDNTYVDGLFSTQIYGNGTHSLDAAANIYGPKYLAIVLDDFNQNRQNTGLVNIGRPDTKLSLPSYYAKDLEVDCSANTVYKPVYATIPRRITQAQIYTINQIKENRIKSKERIYGTNNSDILAVLPIDITSNIQEKPYTILGANVIINERRYFGPVNISRMKLRLIDDKGNTVNLNGSDWVVSLLTTELYQY